MQFRKIEANAMKIVNASLKKMWKAIENPGVGSYSETGSTPEIGSMIEVLCKKLKI